MCKRRKHGALLAAAQRWHDAKRARTDPDPHSHPHPEAEGETQAEEGLCETRLELPDGSNVWCHAPSEASHIYQVSVCACALTPSPLSSHAHP